MTDAFPRLDYKPKLPRNLGEGIGISGTGGSVNYAHLPAYKKAGFKVVGVTDKNRAQAEKTAREHGIPKVYLSTHELLADPDVRIVDVAVYPDVQLGIVQHVTAATKQLLCANPIGGAH